MPVSNKAYGFSLKTEVFNFSVEENCDFGPSTLIKFGSHEFATIEDLRTVICKRIADLRTQRKDITPNVINTRLTCTLVGR